jgi:hypothetical protein
MPVLLCFPDRKLLRFVHRNGLKTLFAGDCYYTPESRRKQEKTSNFEMFFKVTEENGFVNGWGTCGFFAVE